MVEAAWSSAIGATIAAIGSDGFAAELSRLLRLAAPFNYTVVFGYREAARPIDLYDDFPSQKRRIFVTDYQEGPYLLDPFYLACLQPIRTGLHRMRDLAPDRFYQGEYFRNYYVQTGLAEEIGFFVDVADRAVIVVSLMRAERPFPAREIRALTALAPIVEACIRQHWPSVAQDRSPIREDARQSKIEPHIEHAFHTFGTGVLTAREREVVEYTLKGHSAEAVGRIMGIASGTVRIHRRNIYGKLRINSQGELFSSFIDTLIDAD